jgi:transcription initiation factor IIE alpha subunit
VDNARVLAKCDELLRFLDAQEEQPKLRRLIDDIEQLRDRLREQSDDEASAAT